VPAPQPDLQPSRRGPIRTLQPFLLSIGLVPKISRLISTIVVGKGLADGRRRSLVHPCHGKILDTRASMENAGADWLACRHDRHDGPVEITAKNTSDERCISIAGS
jgi:hypothetical protein